MTGHPEISCREFDQDVDELAVGTLAEPERSRLLAHAAECPGCEAELNSLAGMADRLLLLVPEVEPPAGFEAGLGAVGAVRAPRKVPIWRRRTWQLVGAAALALAVLAVGFAAGRSTTSRPTPTAVVSHGDVWTAAGVDIGAAEVVTTPSPHVLVTLRDTLPWGVLSCQLELADGQRITVGTWNYEQAKDGTWGVRIDRSLLAAVMMRMVDQHGAVVAKASLT